MTYQVFDRWQTVGSYLSFDQGIELVSIAEGGSESVPLAASLTATFRAVALVAGLAAATCFSPLMSNWSGFPSPPASIAAKAGPPQRSDLITRVNDGFATLRKDRDAWRQYRNLVDEWERGDA